MSHKILITPRLVEFPPVSMVSKLNYLRVRLAPLLNPPPHPPGVEIFLLNLSILSVAVAKEIWTWHKASFEFLF